MADAKDKSLTATALKQELWDTLQQLRAGTIDAPSADAIASQSREILRTVKIQVQVATVTRRSVPDEVVAFSESHK